MPLVIWSETRSVGDDRMDEEHIGLISLVNHIYDALETGADADSVRRLLAALASAAARHFHDEEEMLVRAGYTGLAEHRAEHAGLLQQIETVREEVARLAARGLAPDVGNLHRVWLLAWVMDHLEGADADYRSVIAAASPSAA
jgi:hemerythrin